MENTSKTRCGNLQHQSLS